MIMLNQLHSFYFLTRSTMIENLKIIKAHLENELVNNQATKTNKKNVSTPKQNNIKPKNKTKNVPNLEPGLVI